MASQRRANALQIAPHVAALDRQEIERRVRPALRLEDRAEQERPPAHRDTRRRSRLLIRMAAG